MLTAERNEQLASMPEDACLRVDLAALAANYRRLATLVAPGCCGAVVKADAYGLGMDRVAVCLRGQGCAHFFVATAGEGVQLRAVLPDRSVAIHVINGVIAEFEPLFVEHGLVPVLNSFEQIVRFAAHARQCSRALPAVLNLDTGMLRLGLGASDLLRLRGRPELLRALTITQVMTHLACADDRSSPANQRQLDLFNEWRATLPPAPTSIGNSAAILLGHEFQGDLARPGIALYGGSPLAAGVTSGFQEVVRLEAPVLQVREVEAAGTVGYGATYAVRPPARLATIGVGYADGYPRSLSNCGSAIIDGRRYPMAGRVSMDLCTIDISAAAPGSVRAGAVATLLGGDLGLDEVARTAGMINYEILTGLGKRLRREYHDGVVRGHDHDQGFH